VGFIPGGVLSVSDRVKSAGRMGRYLGSRFAASRTSVETQLGVLCDRRI